MGSRGPSSRERLIVSPSPDRGRPYRLKRWRVERWRAPLGGRGRLRLLRSVDRVRVHRCARYQFTFGEKPRGSIIFRGRCGVRNGRCLEHGTQLEATSWFRYPTRMQVCTGGGGRAADVRRGDPPSTTGRPVPFQTLHPRNNRIAKPAAGQRPTDVVLAIIGDLDSHLFFLGFFLLRD